MDQPAEQAVVLCPGQGAQHVGMAKSWVATSPVAAKVFAQAKCALAIDLGEICFNGPAEQLDRTDLTQVAIYTTSVACYRAAEQEGRITTVSAAAGLSLGEFTALHLAGAFDFVAGLKLVHLRGAAMQEAVEATDSSMVALTGVADEDRILELCARARGQDDSVLVPANFNSPMQVVISGSRSACSRAVQLAPEMGFRATPLKVAGAFHSPLMAPAAERLRRGLEQVQWQEPRFPVLSNVTGEPHDGKIDSIKQRLVEQLTSPVRWCQTMQWISEHCPGRCIELAPNKVLTGLMRRINRKRRVEVFAEPA